MSTRPLIGRLAPLILGVASMFAVSAAQAADAAPVGEVRYLCCNMRLHDSSVSDINYTGGSQLMPLGTRVKIVDVGWHAVKLEVDGRKVSLDNDYSRAIGMPAFIERYLLKEDPAPALAGLPAETQAAIKAGKVLPGMTRQQVIQAIGYPIVTENPSLDAPVWKYWTSEEDEYDASFDAEQHVTAFKLGGLAGATPCALNVYRPVGSAGGAVRTHVKVLVDGKAVGAELSWGNTVCVDVPAGNHLVELQDQGSGLIGMLSSPTVVAKLTIAAEPGTPIFIRYDTRLQSVFVQVPVTTFEFSDELRWRKRV
jgi:hypothetical protein